MARTVASFARSGGRFKENKRALVLCEDAVSSLTYLREAARHFHAYADVHVAHCGKTDPLGIVSEAVRRRGGFDNVYCAIDRDNHNKKNFDEAVDLARAKGVNLIVSYPCYEFWLLLHFKKSRTSHASVGKSSAADRLIKTLLKQEGMGDYEKGSCEGLFERLRERLDPAIENARWALDESMKDGNLDPSTRLHELIEEFRRMGTLTPA
jgi:hypothetical protein